MTVPLTEQEQRLWHAWKIAADKVRQRVAEDLKAGSGLSDQDFGILTRLAELGGGKLRQNDLGALLRWDRTRLSHQLTRMENRGLVSRSAVDGGVLVRVTDEGVRLVRVARPIHAAAVREHLLQRTEGIDHAALLRALEQLALAPDPVSIADPLPNTDGDESCPTVAPRSDRLRQQ
ncbi:MarR family winged helix-turn-helix transcriptional regulator [Curtobacterium sp. MCJR17_020]|uniref:MarR family winged helix-turn-helix transcriptional regulator n=1 Tax=Curtobacterium sp. MCJR17_020 TaxID=2175619 RepID=UPI000DA9390E|nr:MarR family winged helix-turn-helix transcriptional regulator [Curtobacterium sp. MCJR17_020]WIE74102.1 MarR family winged helix-turn-helix transcriptional regulator [Curtobacterium sp. MCJR17_020]